MCRHGSVQLQGPAAAQKSEVKGQRTFLISASSRFDQIGPASSCSLVAAAFTFCYLCAGEKKLQMSRPGGIKAVVHVFVFRFIVPSICVEQARSARRQTYRCGVEGLSDKPSLLMLNYKQEEKEKMLKLKVFHCKTQFICRFVCLILSTLDGSWDVLFLTAW